MGGLLFQSASSSIQKEVFVMKEDSWLLLLLLRLLSRRKDDSSVVTELLFSIVGGELELSKTVLFSVLVFEDWFFSFSGCFWMGSWVTGSIPILISFFFMCVFQWFFISLSVLPGNLAAIFDHLKPSIVILVNIKIEIIEIINNKTTLNTNKKLFKKNYYSATHNFEELNVQERNCTILSQTLTY